MPTKTLPPPYAGPALAMLHLGEVPLGLRALDALVKEAPVQVHAAGTVQCGQYLILFGGQLEPVLRAHNRAIMVSGGSIVDEVILPDAEERIVPAVVRGVLRRPARGDTLGVIQTASPPTLLRAIDPALKGALVELVELRVGDGLGGKAIASLWGEIFDVEAALSIASDALARGRPEGCSTTIIPNAERDVVAAIQSGTRFFKEWRG